MANIRFLTVLANAGHSHMAVIHHKLLLQYLTGSILASINLWDTFLTFLRFGIVGFACMLIDFGVTYVCKEKIKLHKYVSNGMGFVISATVNYFLNRTFTFHSSDPNMGSQYIIFIIVAVVGLGINTGVVYFVHHTRKQNFYVAKLFATGIVMFWNFFMNRTFTFRK